MIEFDEMELEFDIIKGLVCFGWLQCTSYQILSATWSNRQRCNEHFQRTFMLMILFLGN